MAKSTDIERLEPNIPYMGGVMDVNVASIAISLKRIADLLSEIKDILERKPYA